MGSSHSHHHKGSFIREQACPPKGLLHRRRQHPSQGAAEQTVISTSSSCRLDRILGDSTLLKSRDQASTTTTTITNQQTSHTMTSGSMRQTKMHKINGPLGVTPKAKSSNGQQSQLHGNGECRPPSKRFPALLSSRQGRPLSAVTILPASNEQEAEATDIQATRTIDSLTRQTTQEQELDKRRDSLKNGDVFIYPPIYRRLNECKKCSRDNKICSCNLSADEMDEASVHSADDDRGQPVGDKCHQRNSTGNEEAETNGKHPKTAYKISIATATIDQHSHQVRLSSPTIVSESSEQDHSEAPGCEQAPSRTPAIQPRGERVNQKLQLNHRHECGSAKLVQLSSPVTAIAFNPPTSRVSGIRFDSGISSGRSESSCSSCSSSARSNNSSNGFALESPPAQLPIANEALESELGTPACDVANVTAITIGSPSRQSPSAGAIGHLLANSLVLNNAAFSSSGGSQSSSNGEQAGNNTANSRCINGSEVTRCCSPASDRLTCNLDVGDSIKISSASICIGARQLDTSDTLTASTSNKSTPMTTIVPVNGQVSARRKNLASKLSRQAIYEDYDEDHDESSVPPLTVSRANRAVPMPLAICAKSTGADSDVDGARTSAEKSASDALGYSPILSSVRDYIQNVNPELQFESAGQLPASSVAVTPTIPCIDSTVRDIEIPAGLSQSLMAIGTKAAETISASLLSVTTTTTAAMANEGDIICTSSEQTVTTTTTNGDVELITSDAPSKSILNLHKADALESPKKSIFEGASKDEILEYLEDARERVPEILIAADDVMVIGENEVIVVNQLEPNSPATPISIVERNEDVGTGSTAANCNSGDQVVLASPTDKSSSRITQRIAAMKYGSRIQGSTLDEDMSTNSSSVDVAPSCGSTSFDIVLTSSALSANNNINQSPKLVDADTKTTADSRRQLENFSFATDNTIDSFEDCRLASVNNLCLASADLGIAATQKPSDQTKQLELVTMVAQPMMVKEEDLSLSNLINGSLLVESTNSTDSPERFALRLQRSLNSGRPSGRRNSTSGGSSTHEREKTLQMMLLGRDSLSLSSSLSPHSSPPSSSSPSNSSSQRSTTSNSARTSGECSASSRDFYVSAHLSCSSPYIASNRQSTPSSPAFSVPRSSTPPPMAAPLAIESATESLSSVANQVSHKTAAATCAVNSNEPVNLPDKIAATTVSAALAPVTSQPGNGASSVLSSKVSPKNGFQSGNACNLMPRMTHMHQATINRLNNYFIRQVPLSATTATASFDHRCPESLAAVEFQCLDCDQFVYADQAALMQKSNEHRQMRASDMQLELNAHDQGEPLTAKQLDKAYIAAINGLPLCRLCDKKRVERKEIISEFVDTELKYGRDLKIIHDEFYRPMQIAGLLSKDQINGIFLNLEELIMAHCRFYDRLENSISEAHSMDDRDYNTVNIGKIFVESAEMLHTFESYCIRQGSAACLLARLAKEKELLRIFLRVSQMENTLLRRMNLAAFLMVPVQRVTKYPLLLNRLYKTTAYNHKDREPLRDAQLKVELHLEHINQQTKGVGATNKIWRRISNLSAPISSRRGLNAEDIGYIKLRKTAMDMLKWDREETQFIHSGKINFAPLNEFLIKQRMKPIRYMAAHALLIVLGKPNWKYRPDMVKSSLDNKLMIPTPGGNGIKEAALLLFREKNNRFVPCREPLFLSNCVVSNDCSQVNIECPQTHQVSGSSGRGDGLISSSSKANPSLSSNSSQNTNNHRGRRSISGSSDSRESVSSDFRPVSAGEGHLINLNQHRSVFDNGPSKSLMNTSSPEASAVAAKRVSADNVSMSSQKSLPGNQSGSISGRLPVTNSPPVVQSPRSFSLASALPRAPITTANSTAQLTKSISTTSSNLTILNHLMTKVNSYHIKQTSASANQSNGNSKRAQDSSKSRTISPHQAHSVSTDSNNESLLLSYGSIHSSSSIDYCSQAQTSISQSQTANLFSMAVGNNNSELTFAATNTVSSTSTSHQQQYNHHFFHNHHQPYGDYEESFEIHECITKESMLLRADTPLKTRYWLQILRYHAKDLGHWRTRRNALPCIMMMRHE